MSRLTGCCCRWWRRGRRQISRRGGGRGPPWYLGRPTRRPDGGGVRLSRREIASGSRRPTARSSDCVTCWGNGTVRGTWHYGDRRRCRGHGESCTGAVMFSGGSTLEQWMLNTQYFGIWYCLPPCLQVWGQLPLCPPAPPPTVEGFCYF